MDAVCRFLEHKNAFRACERTLHLRCSSEVPEATRVTRGEWRCVRLRSHVLSFANGGGSWLPLVPSSFWRRVGGGFEGSTLAGVVFATARFRHVVRWSQKRGQVPPSEAAGTEFACGVKFKVRMRRLYDQDTLASACRCWFRRSRHRACKAESEPVACASRRRSAAPIYLASSHSILFLRTLSARRTLAHRAIHPPSVRVRTRRRMPTDARTCVVA